MDKHDFCRLLWKRMDKSEIPKDVLKNSWTYNYKDGHWEFQINKCASVPTGFYWYDQACCAFHAKFEGFSEYLRVRRIK